MDTGLRTTSRSRVGVPARASGGTTDRSSAGRAGRAAPVAWCALLLGIAGVLPALPLVGSFAAMVCAGVWLRDHDLDDPGRVQVLAGLLLGVLGILAALTLAVCGLLGPSPVPLPRP